VLHTARRSSLWDAHCCAPLAAYLRISEQPHLRVLALLPVGFARPPHHCDAGALLPHLFTLATPLRGEAVYFLLHFPSGHPAWPLASTVLYGVRTFLIPPQRDATARQTRTIVIISLKSGRVGCVHSLRQGYKVGKGIRLRFFLPIKWPRIRRLHKGGLLQASYWVL